MRHPSLNIGIAGLLVASLATVVGATAAATSAPVCDPTILVVAGTSPAPSGDASLLAAIETASPSCLTVIADEDVTVADALSFDVVVITSSVQPTVLGDRLRDAAVPILVSESYLFDDMGFVDTNKGQDYGTDTTIRITNPTHPLAAGYSYDVPVYTSANPFGIAYDSAAPGLIPIAVNSAGSTRLTLFGFETGAELVTGTAAAGRVGFFATYGAQLTNQGTMLIGTAINWLLTQPGDLDPDRDAVPSGVDACPLAFDILQFDTDRDGLGDACDPTPVLATTATFVDSSQMLGTDNSNDVALADLDGDGDLDAFIANNGQADTVWFNSGAGVFTNSGQSLGNFNSKGLALGDIDRDGDIDAFVAHVDQPDQVWLNDGTGVFIDSGQTLGAAGSQNAALGDLDGDGDLDAYTANFFGPDMVWLNDGSGVYTAGQAVGASSSQGASLGDIDGDGDLDAVVAAAGASKVWLNDGAATFTDSGQSLAGSFQSRRPGLADVDSDGDLDTLITTDDGFETLWVNDGNGAFTLAQTLGTIAGEHVSFGDLDGDGDLDIFFATGIIGSGRPNQVWLNDGTGFFTDSGQTLGTARSNAAALGDLDGDGDLDAYIANTAGTADSVWINDSQQQPRAVMIAGNTTPPSGDRPIRDRVLAAGYDLTIVDDDSDLESLNLTGVDLLLISTSVVPSTVGDTFKNVPIPVIIWEGYLFDDMGLSDSGETSSSHTDVVISAPDHPLAVGLPAGDVRVYTTANKLSFGAPGPAAEVVAHEPGNPTRAVLFAYESGSLLVDGSASPAPRVALFPTYLGASRLTSQGQALIGAALDWTGRPATGPTEDVLYATGFTGFAVDTVNGQDGWCTAVQGGVSSFPGLDACADSGDGQIVTDSGGNQVLQVLSAPGFGMEVGRDFGEPTEQFLRVEFDFVMKDPAFFFIDIVGPGGGNPDSIYWFANPAVVSNASPGTGVRAISFDTRYRVGVEIDQQSRQITAFRLGNNWTVEDDSADVLTPRQLRRFLFRGVDDGARLWIDNIVVIQSGTSII